MPVFRFKNRKWDKLLNFFWFPFIVFWFLLFSRKYDIITVSTAPQVLLPFSVTLMSKIRGSRLVYHCMDIHPEIGRLSGEFKNKFIFTILQWMDNYTCKVASKIIVLSSDMKESLLKRDKSLVSKIEIINNYNLSSEKLLKDNFFDTNSNIKRVVFTGNIGKFQNLDTFILALKENEPLENFELVFVGEGGALEDLKSLAEPISNCIQFIPHQPVSIARKIISEADMGIVSLQDEVIKYAYPSKTMTYLAEGTPILVCVDTQSEISNFAHSQQLGISVEPSDINKIYKIFKNLSIGTLEFDREHIKKVFDDNLSKKQFNKKLNNLFKDLMEEI